jgi:hypothetical protein
MAVRPRRRVGRSDQERRQALLALQRQWEAKHRRYRLSVEQLRRARAQLEQRLTSGGDQRRAEDRIREEYHDSRATIVQSRHEPA